MSDTRKPVNHGFITPQKPEPKAEPLIPAFLRVTCLHFWSDTEKAIQVYGLWDVKALKELHYCGKTIHAGDIFKLPGNDAVVAAISGSISFCDKRLEKEHDLREQAKKLGVDLSPMPRRVADHRENFDVLAATK